MRYCGIAVGPQWQHLCVLEEVLVDEPPVRLRASFYEPGSVEQVASVVRSLGEVVVAIGAPAGSGRPCDKAIEAMGITAQPFVEPGAELFEALSDLGVFHPPAGAGPEGPVPASAFRGAPVFETNVDAVFAALRGRKVPARRHPFGMRLRIQELIDDRVADEGGDLWNRRAEEIDAAGAALAAHRYALGHACWVGDDRCGIVLPGARVPHHFSDEGVVEPVPRIPLG